MLEWLLRQEIQAKGPLSQSRFMELALHHPLHGYYRSQEAIGHDFTTSPEISQVFGELLGAWTLDYYVKLHQPHTLSLIELGPGKGTLMVDFLRASQLSEAFSKALTLSFVEINPSLKALQQKAIRHPALWIEQLEDLPLSPDPLIIIANEFFDTFPTNCYKRQDNVLYEKHVEIQGNKLVFTHLKLHENQGPDQTWEESPKADTLMNEICSRLLKQTGVFLCVDYGYEKGEGTSLQALFSGDLSDPLSHIGQSDLTCHVNFGHLKEIALARGLGVLGPLSQEQFLKNIGFDLRIKMLKHQNPSQKASLEAAATRLIHPYQMGALFKVMAVFSPPTLVPAGFQA